MADNYGSDDDYGNDADDDNVEEGYSDDTQRQVEYSDGPQNQENQNQGLEGEDEQEQQIPEESQSQHNNYEIIQEEFKDQPNQRRITSPFMTKFEKAKIIGVRAVQISKNSPLYLKNENVANMNWDPITIAEKELAEKRIPFIIRRSLPDGSFEDWKISQLKTFD